jgi:DNA repair exonuclease SbcCD ATPase subunit
MPSLVQAQTLARKVQLHPQHLLHMVQMESANARKQEKDKLYSEIEALKSQFASTDKTLSEIQEQRVREAAEIARIQQEKDDALDAKRKAELSAKEWAEEQLKATNDTWEERFNKLQTERDNERAFAEKERAYNELVDYRNTQLAAAAEAKEIAPQFHNFITGDTKAQIDAAIEQAKLATASIAQELAQAAQQRAQQPRGVAPTGYGSFGPMEGQLGQKTYTAADINNMTMAEYSEFRQKSGLASGEAQRSRGLFG